jgi:hypothetical protein
MHLGGPVESIAESSDREQCQMPACRDPKEPLPPPKFFDRSKPPRRTASKIVMENLGKGYNVRFSLQAPTTRPVHNRNIGSNLLDQERETHNNIPINGGQQSIEIDNLIHGLPQCEHNT